MHIMASAIIIGLLVNGSARAESPKKLKIIRLVSPDTNKGLPLMKALKARKTTRDYSDKTVSIRQLSDLLWAANGINRKDGKRTSPAGNNRQEIDIYVVLKEGIYLWDAARNQLNPIIEGDHRTETGQQDFVNTAPLNLVFVLNLAGKDGAKSRLSEEETKDRMGSALICAGSQTQNVALYCASEGLGNVVRGWIDYELLAKTMKLGGDQHILVAQTVGVPR